jgi:hypothetical protein
MHHPDVRQLHQPGNVRDRDPTPGDNRRPACVPARLHKVDHPADGGCPRDCVGRAARGQNAVHADWQQHGHRLQRVLGHCIPEIASEPGRARIRPRGGPKDGRSHGGVGEAGHTVDGAVKRDRKLGPRGLAQSAGQRHVDLAARGQHANHHAGRVGGLRGLDIVKHRPANVTRARPCQQPRALRLTANCWPPT